MINSVVLTRPQDRGNNLKELLLDRGYQVVQLPCLAIRNLTVDEAANNNYKFNSLMLSDIAIYIFVSVNAVHGFFKLYPEQAITLNATDTTDIKVMAIGSETAKTLMHYGVRKVSYPKEYSQQISEYFVDLPELVNIKDQKIMLIKGDAGRDYIADTIKQRQGILHELIVYKTSCPDDLARDISIKLDRVNSKELLILITSNSILKNFYNNLNTTANKSILHSMLNATLLVVSERIADLAKQYGFCNIIVSNTMNEDSIVDIIADISC
jgi:uroporphyrinogen-III synthase